MVMLSIAALLLQTQVPAPVLAPGETLLEVQAEGGATFLPDMARVSAGVVSTGTTAREATDANARDMAKVVATIRNTGVPDRFVRTQQLNVQPRFARSGPADYQGQAAITGYVAQNSVAITITKLDSASDVIAAAFGAGANSVSGPNLESRDPDAGVAEARTKAIAAARAEAEAYAAGFGLRVARVIRVNERGNEVRQIQYAMASVQYGESRPSPPIAAGEMERKVTVWVDFALTK